MAAAAPAGGAAGCSAGPGAGVASSSGMFSAHQYVFQHDHLPGLLARLLQDNTGGRGGRSCMCAHTIAAPASRHAVLPAQGAAQPRPPLCPAVEVGGATIPLPFLPELWALGQVTPATSCRSAPCLDNAACCLLQLPPPPPLLANRHTGALRLLVCRTPTHRGATRGCPPAALFTTCTARGLRPPTACSTAPGGTQCRSAGSGEASYPCPRRSHAWPSRLMLCF